MIVEIWSDFACPFCYIGKRRFEDALNKFSHKDQVKVIFRSYQLDPHAPINQTQNIHSALAEKYGMSYEKAKAMGAQVVIQAKEVGLDYHFDTMILTNTLAAHRLSHYAKKLGKMEEMMERLLYAYFTESKHLGDYETLIRLAEEIGLDQDEVKKVLHEDLYAEDVRYDINTAAQIGVRGVPFFVFNEKYAVSGAQSADVFLEVLEKVWSEQKTVPEIIAKEDETANNKTEFCTGDSCQL
ncbi:DsbA family oxidoreductase [Bacillus sp. AGMB 02131]|uniref:DsbA family oxidoreductase n=1 Tax=Peribacillus faecalis TaxID=2772559 RepID=A0A927CYW5_9BACI|nr:DsbA family oxidoreductase [Peribacillus faecalis]MBD3108475.1 DsbA family oxidoreductase [Peribacillus faecalis]